MGHLEITEDIIRQYIQSLREQEYAQGSIEKYVRDIKAFRVWNGSDAVEREQLSRWKVHLQSEGYRPETVNGMLASLNCLFKFMGRTEFHLRYVKVQRKLFRKTEREMTKAEYTRLIETAQEQGKRRLTLLMETICATGIRVSEVRYITVEAVRRGRAEICLKGKVRMILLPGKLCKKLLKFAKQQRISAGVIFITRNKKPLSRRQIWGEMKSLCKAAGVAPSKVFPHNLRHLFARTFYRIYKDVIRLADVLGHSSVETTRIYLISTGAEHARQIERLGLVS